MIRVILLFSIAFSSISEAQILNLDDTRTSRAITDLNRELRTQIQLLQLRIPETPQAIRAAELFDHLGRSIEFRMLADPKLGYIIGTHRSDLTLELIKGVSNPVAPQFVVTGHVGEQLVDLTEDDLYITDLGFGEHGTREKRR